VNKHLDGERSPVHLSYCPVHVDGARNLPVLGPVAHPASGLGSNGLNYLELIQINFGLEIIGSHTSWD